MVCKNCGSENVRKEITLYEDAHRAGWKGVYVCFDCQTMLTPWYGDYVEAETPDEEALHLLLEQANMALENAIEGLKND